MPGPERRRERGARGRRTAVRAFEVAAFAPTLAWIAWEVVRSPREFADPMLLVWAVAIAVVDLAPVPTSVDLRFSLSFPLQLAVALIYPPPVAAAVAFAGTSDKRELRRELPPAKALFIRAEITLSVIAESFLFHRFASLGGHWYRLALAVGLATIVGYAINALLVGWYFHLESRVPLPRVLRDMHVGVFGEFVVSYLGLALFSVLVATTFVRIGVWSIAVFIAPLAFAWQMFRRTHSLQVASEELAARQRENEHQALHDALTGLPNRLLFQQRLQESIDVAERAESRLAVMLMDLDHFKEVNDTLGHHFGDELLKEIGSRLATVLRDGDVMARLGGDEFGVVLPELPDDETAVAIAGRLIKELERPLTVEGLSLDVSGSIGIALFPAHARDAESLIRRADVAMYAAKETRAGHEVYHRELDRHSPARLTLVSQVRPGIEHGEFVLHYQPKGRLADGSVTGVEALVRWRHPDRGLLPPAEFLPLVEHTVLLRPLTHHLLEAALRQWRTWYEAGIRIALSVNLSPRSLFDVELPNQVWRVLEETGVPPRSLILELTESFMVTDSGRSNAVLARLTDLGVEISIDDFGTGYSSLSHLKRISVDEIKIDRSFVGGMRDDPNDASIVKATVDLGRNLGLRVVAEGVEDRATWDLLAELACDEAQGYFLAHPMPAEAVTAWLSERTGVVVGDPTGDGAPVERGSQDRLRAV